MLISELSLRQKVGQLFVPGLRGTFLSETSEGWRRLRGDVVERGVGGVLWLVSNVYETAELNRRLQALAHVPLLISADLEAGVGMRFLDTTFWPPAMAIAATGDPSLAEREGRCVAIEARALGINLLLAPVADVNVDPKNPVINARSFGEDPHEVSRYVTAFIRGARSEGVLTTAKHFPGHGDTHIDSHRSLPVLDVARERLERVEFVPFRAAIEAGVDAIMPGHLSVPALEPTPSLPATLSRPILEGLLRGELGFRGLIVSDAFDMGGLTEHFDAGEAAVRAIEAGEDQILMSPDIEAAIAGVLQAVREGRLTEARIDESVRRILEAKARVTHTVASPDEIFRTLDNETSLATANEIARRAITLVRAEEGLLPLGSRARVVTLVVSDFPELTNPLPEFEAALRERCAAAPKTFVLDARATSEEVAPLLAAAGEAERIVIALAIRARSGAGRIGIPPVARAAIEQLIALAAPHVAISFGNPYLIHEVPALRTYLCAYGVQPVLQLAAARAMFGEAEITGKLPVTL
jgi:beta-N-acetylhexosaminidase